MFTNISLAKTSHMAEPSIRVDGTKSYRAKGMATGDHEQESRDQSNTGHIDQFYLERKSSLKMVNY